MWGLRVSMPKRSMWRVAQGRAKRRQNTPLQGVLRRRQGASAVLFTSQYFGRRRNDRGADTRAPDHSAGPGAAIAGHELTRLMQRFGGSAVVGGVFG
jgi:hypothetical protein